MAALSQFHRAVVIAMATVRMVQMSVHQIIHMVAMRHRLMTASRTMDVVWCMSCASVGRRAGVGIGCGDGNHVLIHMVSVRMVQMPVMQIIDMPFMQNGGMATVRAMLVRVVIMVGMFAGGHIKLLLY